jgi:hypothetical protein
MRNIQIGLALMTVLPLGCATAPRPAFTGFLGDYTEFKPYAALPGAFEYWAPNAGQRKYTSILLDPIEVHFAPEKDSDPPDAERVTAFKRFVENELNSAIARHYPIASQPGSDVARLRLQISNIRLLKQLPSTPSYTHLRRYRLGSANIEAELADSVSGKTIVAWVGPRRSAGEAESFSRPKDWAAVKSKAAASIHHVADRVFAKLRESWNRRTFDESESP